MAALPTPPLPSTNYGELTTPFLFSELLTFFFGGIWFAQAYIYYIAFPQDSRVVKLYVHLVSAVTVIFLCANASDVYDGFCTGYGNVQAFFDPDDTKYTSAISSSGVALLVQIFFCYRLILIRRAAWPVALFIVLVALVQCASGIAVGVLYRVGGNLPDDPRFAITTRVTEVNVITNAAAAILVAVATSYLLLTATVIPSTRTLLRNIVFLTIQTNTITAAVAVVTGVLYTTFPGRAYFFCPLGIVPIMYVNTLFATLNHRAVTAAAARALDADGRVNDVGGEALWISDFAEGELPGRGSGATSCSLPEPPMVFAPRHSMDVARRASTRVRPASSVIVEVRRSLESERDVEGGLV
ncbi:hypothetical protein C8R46DRAFT_1296461 [Mycena filopes]|nr:hypothetical protein C8R46DRAFT_1296461 [Mycena filopes]